MAALAIFLCYFFYSFGAQQLFDFSAMAFKAPLTSGELWQNWVDVLNILGVLVLAHTHLCAKALDYERLEKGFAPEWWERKPLHRKLRRFGKNIALVWENS